MFRLRLFGGASLDREDGSPLAGRAAQRHRLALLALLACAPRSGVSRDKLVALLWPESDTERARNLLNVSVYELRKAFGEGAIVSQGDELRLDRDALVVDVVEFDAAMGRGDHETAVALFRGPFLDGFFVADAAEFERWTDGERERLAGAYARALEALAEAAERRRDFKGAAEWWRKRAAHDPYDSRVAISLMQALDAGGNRAGALQHASIHERLLRDEVGLLAPSPVAAFAEQLRAEPVRADPPRPSLTPPELESGEDDSAVVVQIPTGAAGEVRVDPAGAGPVHDAPPPAPQARGPGSPRRAVRLAAVMLAAIVTVGAVGWALWPDASPTARSVAVLPFANMSGDAENGYFSDGLTEQIITALSHVQGLRVAARTSSFALRDGRLDVRVIGDTLDVEAVLEGSVRRQGSRIKVTAQLIDAVSGFHLWSGEYDRQVSDVIAVQDEIARAIASALELRLPRSGATAPAQRTPSLAAYDLYLRARHLRDDLSRDAMRSAMELLDRATELESDFALAWAEKANVMGPAINFGYVPQEQGVAEMRAAVERALELDPELGEAHVALGILRLFYEWDWAAGERALRRAVDLNPNDQHAWHHLGNQLSVAGRIDEAVDARLRGIALDPLNARARSILAVELRNAGRHDEALAEYERARQLDPMNPNVLGLGPAVPIGAEIHLMRGRADDAVQELLRVAALRGATPGEMDALRAAFAKDGMRGVWRSWLDMDLRQSGSQPDPLRLAALWAYAGDADQALDWLERAYAARGSSLVFLRTYPAFAELRSRPRFVRIVEEMKLPAH
ncbi:MAG TPA: BTAD domain-containing putative transcriptional regulator [Gemmatimonadaceae bacterium]|nr:BTAD domain-containing putative transcriptional regulator [Gemmatimonadaceae bacterium]